MANRPALIKPIAAAVGVAFVSSLVISSTAIAADNPFELDDLDAGYMLAGGDEDKGEEGKCGEDKGEEGTCGEDKGEEGKCGEGKCGEEGEEDEGEGGGA